MPVLSENDCNPEYVCRVCGYRYDTPTWEYETGSQEICLCCGVQFGLNDCSLEQVRDFREKWLKDGGTWRMETIFTSDRLNELWDANFKWQKQQKKPFLLEDKETWIRELTQSTKAPPQWDRKEQMKNIPSEWL